MEFSYVYILQIELKPLASPSHQKTLRRPDLSATKAVLPSVAGLPSFTNVVLETNSRREVPISRSRNQFMDFIKKLLITFPPPSRLKYHSIQSFPKNLILQVVSPTRSEKYPHLFNPRQAESPRKSRHLVPPQPPVKSHLQLKFEPGSAISCEKPQPNEIAQRAISNCAGAEGHALSAQSGASRRRQQGDIFPAFWFYGSRMAAAGRGIAPSCPRK